MIEPTNFTDPEFKSDSENYDLLLEKGISLVQNYSGENWTDYNYHDPGVTLLEQLCYALTDLGYRTNFPIEDLLIGKKTIGGRFAMIKGRDIVFVLSNETIAKITV